MAAQLGLGGGALDTLSSAAAAQVLDAAVAHRFALVDVARSYGEEPVAAWQRARGARRLPVQTKGGYAVPGCDDWSAAAVAQGIARAWSTLGAVDTFLLHSCGGDVLARDAVIEALVRAREAGTVRGVGYSGDNLALHQALDRATPGVFDVVEMSLSLLDGKARVHTLPRARAAGLRVVCKRALANAPWRFTTTPQAPDLVAQQARFLASGVREVAAALGLSCEALFLRYALHTPGIDVVLVGASTPERIARACELKEQGPLQADVHAALAPVLAQCTDDSVV